MVRVKGPLHSDEASGTFLRQITFVRSRFPLTGWQHVRPYFFASQRIRSREQYAGNAAFATAATFWANLTVTQKELWDTYGAADNMSGYNAFLGCACSDLNVPSLVRRDPPPGELHCTTGTTAITAVYSAQNPDYILVSWTDTTDPNAYSVAVYGGYGNTWHCNRASFFGYVPMGVQRFGLLIPYSSSRYVILAVGSTTGSMDVHSTYIQVTAAP